MAAQTMIAYCPRCDKPFSGEADNAIDAWQAALKAVRDHLVRAQGADLDDGLHDLALEQWDNTN